MYSQFELQFALASYFGITVFIATLFIGLPYQAILQYFQRNHVLWFVLPGLLAGFIFGLLIAHESAKDEHAMGSILYFGMTQSDWVIISLFTLVSLFCPLVFWLIRRPDLDEPIKASRS